MAERFEKTYISVHEFVSSWDKEIYEFNNLDYFTFLLINNIGYRLEHEFFNQQNKNPYLQIEPDEIGTLSFNIGDSFESFLEDNCYGECSLSCPTKLNDKFSPEEIDHKNNHFHILQILSGSDFSKKQFLFTDILNYVVLDSLFDFYNYEIGLDLDDADLGLLQIADFITSIIEKFIEIRGQILLKNPIDSASNLFENLIQNEEENWEDSSQSSIEDEETDAEMWKYGNYSVNKIINEYLADLIDNENGKTNVLLKYFQDYAENYACVMQINEFTKEDLEEFFTYWLIREMTLEQNIDLDDIKKVFDKFFTWLELSKEFDLQNTFSKIMHLNFSSIKNALDVSRIYFNKNSIIDNLIEVNSNNKQIVSGYFEVEKIDRSEFIRLKDIHLKKTYFNVQINFPPPYDYLTKTILDACIKPTAYGWRIVNLEYIFPLSAKFYLH